MVVEVEHRFASAPETVYALLTDVERMAELGPEHRAAQWLDGVTFTGRNTMGDRTWEVTCHVIERDPPRTFAWTVGDVASPSSTWSYVLTPDGAGTLVRQRFAHGPGFSFLRAYVERDPDAAAPVITGRAQHLQANMLTVLRAAEALLRDPA